MILSKCDEFREQKFVSYDKFVRLIVIYFTDLR